MQNLQYYNLIQQLNAIVNQSNLPLYAKTAILKELTIEFEKKYFAAVELEYKEETARRAAEESLKQQEE